jgi:hypothetical protein
MSTWNNNVKLFVDGVDTLSAASINPAITQLASRDQYLFEQLNSYTDKSVLVSNDQPMSLYITGGDSGALTTAGAPVYFDTEAGQPVLKGALAGYTSSTGVNHLEPNASAYVFGIVKTVYSGTDNGIVYGDVYIRGLITDIDMGTMLDTQSISELNGADLAPQPLYLSSLEPGRLSILATGASIFVGYYLTPSAFVLAPNIDALNQLYFNYKLYLRPVAVGTPSSTDGHSTITLSGTPLVDLTNKIGWITADDAVTYLQLVKPANAKFYYNLITDIKIKEQHLATYLTDEEARDAYLLKKALPAYPSAYTLFFVNGLLQIANDADHAAGAYIINENGIWWTDDRTDYVPWTTDQEVRPLWLELLITKLNPNYAASVVTSLTSTNIGVSITDNNGLAAKTGDLALTLALPITPQTVTGAGTGVSGLTFDSITGILTVNEAPAVHQLIAGPGINISNTATGYPTVSLSSFTLSGEVTDIEPVEAEYVYKGLNAYLRIKQPAAGQRIGFVGKIKLPATIPSGLNLNINLVAFVDSGNNNTADIPFDFEYNVTNDGTAISSSLISSAVVVPYNSLAINVQNTLSGATRFYVPSSKLSSGAYVNFRIARKYLGNNTAQPIGIIGVLWSIN